MARLMVSTTVYLTREQYDLLKRLAKKLGGAPIADLVRAGVDMVLDTHRARLLAPEPPEPPQPAAPDASCALGRWEALDTEPLPGGMLAVSADANAPDTPQPST